VIEIVIRIKQKPVLKGQTGGQFDVQVLSTNPTQEEVSDAALVMEKLREIAEDISHWEGSPKIKTMEIKKETNENINER
jgi:hypothetical protein